MSLTLVNTNLLDVRMKVGEQMDRIKLFLFNRLVEIAERCVETARNNPPPAITLPAGVRVKEGAKWVKKGYVPPHQPNYFDWTYDLRSSIGYVIYANGKYTIGGFKSARQGRSKGVKWGIEKAKAELASYGNSSLYGVSIIAGAEYAVYVHNLGYDVLDSAELQLQREMPILIQNALKRISKLKPLQIK